MKIHDIALQSVEDIEKKYKVEAEVCVSSNSEIKVTMENNRLHVASSDTSTWAGVRVFSGKSVGFSSVNDLEKISKASEEAIAIAKSSPKEDANVLPEPTNLPSVSGLYDSRIAKLDISDAMRFAGQLLENVMAIDKRLIMEGEFSISVGKSAIVSSKGVSAESKGTGIVYFLIGQAVDGPVVGSFDYNVHATTNLDTLDLVNIPEKLAKGLVDTLGAKKGNSFKGSAIFFGDALQEVLLSPLIYSMTADSIQLGASALAGKFGKQVTSKELTIKDWGRAPGRIGSGRFDREGVSPKTIYPLKNGVFTDMFYNARSAARDKTVSNGHASGSANSSPSSGPTTLFVNPGKDSLENLLKDTKKGVLIKRFSGNVDPQSGDFSGIVKGGYLIENGRITTPLLGTMI
ncbi:MAG: TldD/PmbA family protein, partial [Caldiserica bacterium]|nr:TldD/PmbA family protein [Caldisericota bacterium]